MTASYTTTRDTTQPFYLAMQFATEPAALRPLCMSGLDRDRKAHDRFMRGCMEDHKEYECTAMWRAGSRSDPNVVVVPIPVPLPR